MNSNVMSLKPDHYGNLIGHSSVYIVSTTAVIKKASPSTHHTFPPIMNLLACYSVIFLFNTEYIFKHFNHCDI